MDTDPIDTTPILAQPREFAQRLARVEYERAELIETVARLRAERDDAQTVARAYILRAEEAETKMLREMMDVDVVVAVMAERDSARAEVARLTAALVPLIEKASFAWATLDHNEYEAFVSRFGDAIDAARAALRQPDPAQGQE